MKEEQDNQVPAAKPHTPERLELQLGPLMGLFQEFLGNKIREGVHSVYANTVNFEIGDVDVKLLFGQSHRVSGNAAIDWHTAVTLGWVEVKLISFYLQANIASYELNNGTIKIPTGMLPPPLTNPASDDPNPKALEIINAVESLREELLAEQRELRS